MRTILANAFVEISVVANNSMELLFAPNNTSVQNGYQYHCNVSRMLTTGFTQFRDIMAMAAGAAAGILGFVNFNGFLFYLVVHIITSVALLSKVKIYSSNTRT